jgi:NAD(P)H-quinone oxidoreductase subunit 5
MNSQEPTASLLPLLVPLPLLAMLLLPRGAANAMPVLTAKAAQFLVLVSFLFSVVSAGGLALAGYPLESKVASCGPVALSSYYDTVSAVMLVLAAFLAVAVIRFSGNYLAGNPDQGRFFKWLSVTAGCVLLLVVSGNLALFVLSWSATSLALHKLLTFYPDRPAAMMAARKKFLFSRLGDIALLAALWTAWHAFGTLDYAPLFAAASGDAGERSGSIQGIALLLVLAAVLKSAQFPFHGWLPDTMETPTPVSALMHAGIINAGGFLIIRFSPLMAKAPHALELLAAVGGFTALFGSLVMITQTSVKRTLAFSTVAQMGFMMLQCGLGAFALALLHIVAHSLYKAHAFLSSGSVIAAARAAGSAPARRYRGILGALAAFSVAGVLVVILSLVSGGTLWADSGRFGLGLILAVALAQLLWHWWSTSSGIMGLLSGLAVAAGVGLLSVALHEGTRHLLGTSVAPAPTFTLAWPIALITAFSFLLLALRAFLPPTWVSTAAGRTLFVHAYNGFYVNTAANRLIVSLWPPRARKS